MYIAVVGLTMFVLPIGSIWIEKSAHPEAVLLFLIGKWFVFWAVGVRLGLAGLRQVFQPEFTAHEIFHMAGDEGLPVVRELGVANLSTAIVALCSVAVPTFTLPVAIASAIFYGVAGATHILESDRSTNENVAMVSDIFIFIVLAAFVGLTIRGVLKF